MKNNELLTYVVLSKMRQPLIILLLSYFISIMGLVIIPANDANGNEIHISFFHAFYIVLYTSTTIGFGEIPYQFNDYQRFWLVFVILFTVIAWLNAIGSLIKIINNKVFITARRENKIARIMKKKHSPFYIVCGIGTTGEKIVSKLNDIGYDIVIIEQNETTAQSYELSNMNIMNTVLIIGDARTQHDLMLAGINKPECKGIIITTSNEETNTKTSILSKIINPNIYVISKSFDTENYHNLKSFNTDYVINPIEEFTESLKEAIYNPQAHHLKSLITNDFDSFEKIKLGKWIFSGGNTLTQHLMDKQEEIGFSPTIITKQTKHIPDKWRSKIIVGTGVTVEELNQAGILDATAIVASTKSDILNLSAIITAKKLNPSIQTIAELNNIENLNLYTKINTDIIVNPHKIFSERAFYQLREPWVKKFISLTYYYTSSKLDSIIKIIANISTPRESWVIRINEYSAYAPHYFCEIGMNPKIKHIINDPDGKECIPLLLIREDTKDFIDLPDLNTIIKENDELLVISNIKKKNEIVWGLNNPNLFKARINNINET